MEEKSSIGEPELRESGACWAIPGVIVAALLVLFAFLSPFTSPAPAVDTQSLAASSSSRQ